MLDHLEREAAEHLASVLDLSRTGPFRISEGAMIAGDYVIVWKYAPGADLATLEDVAGEVGVLPCR
jgi:hypothetical protein